MRQLTFDDIFESLQQAVDSLKEADQAQIDEETEAELASKVTESSPTILQLNALYNKAMETGDYQAALKAIGLKLEYGV